MFALILTVLGQGSDVARLGADEFETREEAQARLRSMGPLAVAALVAGGVTCDDPEIRFRAGVLLRPWWELAAEQRAEAVLYSPWPVDPARFYADRRLRERVKRLARAAGCDGQEEAPEGAEWYTPPPITEDLTPDERFNEFQQEADKLAVAANALAECRRVLRVEPVGWPFR